MTFLYCGTVAQNYRQNSLLVTKVFTEIITNKICATVDSNQPGEQAGFLNGCSTTDYIYTINQIVKSKTTEHNDPLCMVFIEYEKEYDSVTRQGVGEPFLKALEDIEGESTATKTQQEKHKTNQYICRLCFMLTTSSQRQPEPQTHVVQ